jgi:hypothetical protein
MHFSHSLTFLAISCEFNLPPRSTASKEYALSQPVELFGLSITSLEEAAYAVRQYAIDCGDIDAWRLVQKLRGATTTAEAHVAAMQLAHFQVAKTP